MLPIIILVAAVITVVLIVKVVGKVLEWLIP